MLCLLWNFFCILCGCSYSVVVTGNQGRTQDFGGTPPTLSSSFIVENAPMSRIEAVSTGYDFIFDAQFSYHCARPMPVYSVPGLVDHF